MFAFTGRFKVKSAAVLEVLSVAALCCAAILFAAPATADVLEMRPGFLIDDSANAGYLMTPDALVAVRLDLGTEIWRSEEAARPLAVVGSTLLAQRDTALVGRLELVALNAASGQVTRSLSIELPENVAASVEESLGSTFEIRATPNATPGGVVVNWRSERRIVQGIAPIDGQKRVTTENGAFAIDLGTGATASTAPSTPSRRAVYVLEGTDRIDGAGGRQFRATDEQHVLASERLDSGDLMERYKWSLYTSSGSLLGSFNSPVSYSGFLVVGSNVIYETPAYSRRVGEDMESSGPRIRSVALGSGLEQWSFELRETRYRGPLPP